MCNGIQAILGHHSFSMGVKRSVLNNLYVLGVAVSYQSLPRLSSQLAVDYNKPVRHQTLCQPKKHISATSLKLIMASYMAASGLKRCMLHPEVKLTMPHVSAPPGNSHDKDSVAMQRTFG